MIQDCDHTAEDAYDACFEIWKTDIAYINKLRAPLTSGEGDSESLDAGQDLDGDGIGDLAMAGIAEHGDGEDLSAIHLFFGPLELDVIRHEVELGLASAAPVRVLAANVDGDGATDVVGSYPDENGLISVWHGPITVDRTLDEAGLRITGGTHDAILGVNLRRGGDLAGTGLTTLITTDSRTFDDRSEQDGGLGQVVVLDATGMGEATRDDLVVAQVTGTDSNSRLGLGAIGDTDLDGDGLVDLILTSGTHLDGGDLAFFQGPVTGALGQADATWLSETGLGGLGMGLDAGDLDGDGHADLALGAINQKGNGQDLAGAVLIVAGPLTSAVDPVSDAFATIEGQDERGYLGSHVSVRDVDGDGAAELVTAQGFLLRYSPGWISSAGPRAMYVFRGPVAGTVSAREASVDLGEQSHFATRSILVPDVTGDGLGDLVVPGAQELSGEDGRPRDTAFILPWPGY
ncbi:MAG: VCBS repeat-containing protein [Proteobacteria bacterium]|nr:VCBS repeat-containing protein [Pseudomonadota bacterium]